MQATIDRTIPDFLQKRVISKGQREGLEIPTPAEFYQAWVDGELVMPPRRPEPFQKPEPKKMSGEEWIAGFKKFVEELNRCPRADSRPLCEILEESRNRLEPDSPSLYPDKVNQKTTKDGRG